jgi:hypothetical protein
MPATQLRSHPQVRLCKLQNPTHSESVLKLRKRPRAYPEVWICGSAEFRAESPWHLLTLAHQSLSVGGIPPVVCMFDLVTI